MQRTTPLRNPHTSTSDLLTWSEQPPPESSSSAHRSRHQPSDKISEVLRGSQLTVDEVHSLTKNGQSNFLFSGEPVKKTLRKIHEQKFAEMTGNNIFKVTAGSLEKPLSRAKLREMTGNNIFADGKAESRDYIRGARRPSGGGSSIALV